MKERLANIITHTHIDIDIYKDTFDKEGNWQKSEQKKIEEW